MMPKDVIKIAFLNKSMKSSTSRGSNSASDVTGNKLPYPSDSHSWWMLVRLVIKLQPILETAAENMCKGLQNMNFWSKTRTLLHAYTFLITDSHSWGNGRDLGGDSLCSASWAMALMEQPAWELDIVHAILHLHCNPSGRRNHLLWCSTHAVSWHLLFWFNFHAGKPTQYHIPYKEG